MHSYRSYFPDTEKVQINFAEWEFRFMEPGAQSAEALPIVFTNGNSKNSPRVPLNGAVDVCEYVV